MHQALTTTRELAARLLLSLLLACPAAAGAAQTDATPQATVSSADTPRAAMRSYLESCRAGDYGRAADYLDLRHVPQAERAARGQVLARQLKIVLDRTLWVDLEALSDSPEGEPNDDLPASRDRVGTIATAAEQVPVLLDRVRSAGDRPAWKIAPATTRRIPALYEEHGFGKLGDYLPPLFFEARLFEIQLWQWIGLAVAIVLSLAGGLAITALTMRMIRPLRTRFRILAKREVRLVVGPLRLVVALLAFSALVYPLGLAVPVQAVIRGLKSALLIAATTWLLMRGTSMATRAIRARLMAPEQALARSVIPLGQRAVQAIILGGAILAVLHNFGVNVTGILAGLGIGGLAVALAAQKSIESLFGGLTLIFDQPVRVGDFCRFGERMGTVEEVGLRSTRVRTLDRTVVTIPNSTFSAMEIENLTLRDRFWFRHVLNLRYETTPDQLRHVLVELKKLLLAHPKVHPDPARARFIGLGEHSLDVELFAYVNAGDVNDFLAVQEDILLRIIDIVAASGTGFAFPSRTIYAAADTGLDAARGSAAEEQVRRWRDEHALPLPGFPAEEAATLGGTLDYPPVGSAQRGLIEGRGSR